MTYLPNILYTNNFYVSVSPMKSIEIKSTFSNDIDCLSLSNLFYSVGWGRRCPEKLARAFSQSNSCCFVYLNDKLIGCGRSIDDQEFYSLLVDIIVHPDHQNQGIGSIILNQLTESLHDLPWVILSAEVGTEGFYKKNQFKKMKLAYMLQKRDGQEKYSYA